MKFLLFLIFNGLVLSLVAQKKDFTTTNISLPPEISYYDNQFSGLYIHDEKLYLMSESRIQDNSEAKLYIIHINNLAHKLIDTAYILPYKKVAILNLQMLTTKMKANGDDYEGLEAMVIKGKDVYLSVETTTESDNCYLLKGRMNDSTVVLNEDDIIRMPKPLTADGKHIYNAGFEAMVTFKNALFGFFEYNYFPLVNKVNKIKLSSFKGVSHKNFTIDKLPFRITDITRTGKKSFTAINFFYKGSGEDEVYRVPLSDIENNLHIKDSAGYHNYCRLINIKYNKHRFTWTSGWEFPIKYSSTNWEGIAAYKNGYFIINDKYTETKPYTSILLYITK